MSSWAFSSASTSVAPSDVHPGRSGTVARKPPPSLSLSGSMTTAYRGPFMLFDRLLFVDVSHEHPEAASFPAAECRRPDPGRLSQLHLHPPGLGRSRVGFDADLDMSA